MKKLFLLVLVMGLLNRTVLAQEAPDSDTLFQVSTLGALSEGVFEGALSFGDLKTYGDFGVGTFDAVDGEMVAFDGEFYQITVDGVAKPVEDALTTPFAAVTFFEADQTLAIEETMSCPALYEYLLTVLPSPNWLYAIRIEGSFATLQTRSVAPQTEPYPTLAEVVAEQAVFDFAEVEATLAGFWLPPYMGNLNATGYHFHALTADKTSGGHVLDCQVSKVSIGIDYTDQLALILPANEHFLDVNLTD